METHIKEDGRQCESRKRLDSLEEEEEEEAAVPSPFGLAVHELKSPSTRVAAQVGDITTTSLANGEAESNSCRRTRYYLLQRSIAHVFGWWRGSGEVKGCDDLRRQVQPRQSPKIGSYDACSRLHLPPCSHDESSASSLTAFC